MKNYVLEEDIIQAGKLYELCYHCLNRAEFWLLLDREDHAEHWMEQFQLAKAELLYLRQKKLAEDKQNRRLAFENQPFLRHFGVDDDFIS